MLIVIRAKRERKFLEKKLKPLARKLIEDQYIKRGNAIYIVVRPSKNSGLPEKFIQEEHPVRLNLLTARPLDLYMDDNVLQANLCFDGPPIRCTFTWDEILVVGIQGIPIQTARIISRAIMEEEEASQPFQKRTETPILRRIK